VEVRGVRYGVWGTGCGGTGRGSWGRHPGAAGALAGRIGPL